MGLRKRIVKVVVWGVIFVLAVMAGAIGFAFTYITDSATLVALLNTKVPEYLPTSWVKVEKVELRPLVGHVNLTQLTLVQTVDDRPFSTSRIPWVQVRCDLRKLWKGEFEPREVIVAQPTLRLKRSKEGHWNLEGLLADPWPDTPLMTPVVRISKGTVELIDGRSPVMVVHDVDLTFEPAETKGVFTFSGSAQGDAFERVIVEGRLDARTGAVSLSRGSVEGLALSEALANRLPQEYRPLWDQAGLTAGVLDVEIQHLRCGQGVGGSGIDYALSLNLQGGAWSCPKLPFPLSEVSASAHLENGRLTVSRAQGGYGKTLVRVRKAEFDANDPVDGPMSMIADVFDLELDAALRARLPADLQQAWDEFAPEGQPNLGRVSLSARAERATRGTEVDFLLTANLQDVACEYFLFPFSLEHIHGQVTWHGLERITLDNLETIVMGHPMTASGVITHPGPEAEVEMDFTAGAIPIDEAGAFVKALPEDIRQAVVQFHPTGTVRGGAHLSRRPNPTDPTDPAGIVKVDAILDLNEGCSVRWDGLPYQVSRLSGRLEVHPDHCSFTNMRGENGEARIEASGRVDLMGPGKYAADVILHADRLRFDDQLRRALPHEWQATWTLLNPGGYSTVDSHVVAGYPDPKKPDRTQLTVRVIEDDEAQVKLRLRPAPGTPGLRPGDVIELPVMRDVSGLFHFDNGLVTMTDVNFLFREAPVNFRSGSVRLETTGQFALKVQNLEVNRLRLDADLRRIMPTMMAEFSEKLDDGRALAMRGNLGIGWSGKSTDPAVCSWDHAQMFFRDNSIAAGLPLEHIQGQFREVKGWSDGRSVHTEGLLEIDSLILADQQISGFRTPVLFSGGKVSLTEITASLLDGQVWGNLDVTLGSTPEYKAAFRVEGADLARYAQTLRGHQQIAGKVSGYVELTGAGSDLRRLNGSGEAHVRQGNLGSIPVILRIIQPMNNLLRNKKADFDSADVHFTIQDGEAQLDPIKITGNTLSLYGAGTLSPQGDVDLAFKPLYGRDEKLHVPVVSDLTREFGGQLFVITARGSLGSMRAGLTPLPGPSRTAYEFLRKIGERRGAKK